MKPTRTTHTRRMPRLLRRWRMALGHMASWKFIVLLLVLTFAAKVLALLLFGLTAGIDDADTDSNRAERVGWFVAVILAPLIETLIAQALVIRIVRWAAPASFLLPVVVSAILFGCGHAASPLYAVCMFFVGLVWAFAYLSRLERRGFAQAFWLVAAVHALNNSLAFII